MTRSEITVPDAMELVEIIRRGIESWEAEDDETCVTPETITALEQWCAYQTEYVEH